MVSTRALNRALLARQLLLERAAAPPGRSPRRCAGCRPSMRRPATSACGRARPGSGGPISPRRSSVRRSCRAGSCATPSTWSRRRLRPFTDAVRHARRAQWLRADKRAAGLDMPAVADAVRRYLADGPLTQPRLVALLEADGFPRVAWVGAQLWVDLLRVPPAGTWEKPRAHLFALAEHVLSARSRRGGLPPTMSRRRELLVTRYLRAFGPASPPTSRRSPGSRSPTSAPCWTAATCGSSAREAGGELVDVPDGAASRTPACPRPCASWAPGTPRCSCTPGAPSCCRRRYRSARLRDVHAAFGADVPRRRPGRRHLVLRRWAGRDHAVPRPARRSAPCRRRGGRAARGLPRGFRVRHVRAGGRSWWRRRERAARRAGVRRRSRTARGVRPERPCRTARVNRAARARRRIHAVMAESIRSASSRQQWRRRHPVVKILPVGCRHAAQRRRSRPRRACGLRVRGALRGLRAGSHRRRRPAARLPGVRHACRATGHHHHCASRSSPNTGSTGCSGADLVAVPATRLREFPEEALQALRDASAAGATLLTVCTGVFVLGAAGLLDGRRCTAHWKSVDELRARHPAGDHRPGRALRRRRQPRHQCRHRSRHRRRAAPGAPRARQYRRQRHRPPHGRAAAARRRPAPVRRAADPAVLGGRARPDPGLGAGEPERRALGRRPGPPRPDVGPQLRAPVRRRDRHHPAPLAHPATRAARAAPARGHRPCRRRRRGALRLRHGRPAAPPLPQGRRRRPGRLPPYLPRDPLPAARPRRRA